MQSYIEQPRKDDRLSDKIWSTFFGPKDDLIIDMMPTYLNYV